MQQRNEAVSNSPGENVCPPVLWSERRPRRIPRENTDLGNVLSKIHRRRHRKGSTDVPASVEEFGQLLTRSAVPRVLRRDIRKHYIDYAAAVRNSFDVSLLMDFLHTFVNPDFRTIMRHEAVGLYADGIGCESLFGMLQYLQKMIPDSYVTMKPSHLVAGRRGGAVVSCECVGCGTVILSRSSNANTNAHAQSNSSSQFQTFELPYADEPVFLQELIRVEKIGKRVFTTKYEGMGACRPNQDLQTVKKEHLPQHQMGEEVNLQCDWEGIAADLDSEVDDFTDKTADSAAPTADGCVDPSSATGSKNARDKATRCSSAGQQQPQQYPHQHQQQHQRRQPQQQQINVNIQPLPDAESQWRTVSSNNYTSGVVAAIPGTWSGIVRFVIGKNGKIDLIEALN